MRITPKEYSGLSCGHTGKVRAHFLFPVLVALFISGCSTSRTFEYPYPVVASALKEKFGKDDDFNMVRAKMEDDDNAMNIAVISNVNFDFSLDAAITAEKKGDKETAVTASVTEHYRKWDYNSRNELMEQEFLDLLEKRIKTGKWEQLPWEKKKELKKKNIFSAIFSRTKD